VANPQPMGPRSAALVAYLTRLPRFVLVLGALAILLGGLFAPGIIGALLLAVIAALTGWLAWLSWSTQSPPTRALRILVIAALIWFAVDKVV
jgi:hypothetical protein